ncbi:MAG: succinate dehydrogenase, hydrophobic membrane anchor protein [Parvularculaceae bacterium]
MSSKGTASFIFLRITGALLLPLVVWLLFSFVSHAGDSYEEVRAWLSDGVAAIPMGALFLFAALHMRAGASDVIHDYIHSGVRGTILMLNWLAAIAIAAAGLWSIYQLAFAG